MKNLLLALLLIVSSTACAENWQLITLPPSITSPRTSTMSVDMDSVIRKENLSTAWFRQDFVQRKIYFYTKTTYNCNSLAYFVGEAYLVTSKGERTDILTVDVWKIVSDNVEQANRDAICR